MKTLKSFSNLAEAGFAHSFLEAAGLHSFLADEQMGGSYSPIALQGIRLQVDEAEYEHALRIIAEGLDAEPPPAADGPSPLAGLAADPNASGQIPVGVFAAVAVGFVILCYVVGDKSGRRNPRTHAGAAAEEVQTRDLNRDGKPDQFWFYRRGQTVRYEGDRNFDGRIDEWDFFRSDGMVERSEYDSNNDGKADIWDEYRNSVLVARRQDTDFNGVPDLFMTYKDNVLSQIDVRPNDSPVVIRRSFFTSGVLREEWVDEDADGKFDYRIEFDPFGKPSEHLPMAVPK